MTKAGEDITNICTVFINDEEISSAILPKNTPYTVNVAVPEPYTPLPESAATVTGVTEGQPNINVDFTACLPSTIRIILKDEYNDDVFKEWDCSINDEVVSSVTLPAYTPYTVKIKNYLPYDALPQDTFTGVTDGEEYIDFEYNVTKGDYFCFRSEQDGSQVKIRSSYFQYTYKSNQWVQGSGTVSLTPAAGEAVYVKGVNTTLSYNYEGYFAGLNTGKLKLKGNLLSCIYGDDFASKNTLPSGDTFTAAFSDSNAIVDVSNIKIPVTAMTSYACNGMFSGCTSLTGAPELPVTTIADHCYYNMFQGCTSLTTAPELPATTLQDYCYANMFRNCTSLTAAPALPATTLQSSCYSSMFYGCTSLERAPELSATTLVSNCFKRMFYGCSKLNYIKALFTTTPSTTYTSSWVDSVASSGTFVKSAAATWNVRGVDGIPNGWTVQTA